MQSRSLFEWPTRWLLAGLLFLVFWIPPLLQAEEVPSEDSWPEFISRFQIGLDAYENGIDEIITLIEGQKPFLVERRGRDGLRIKWSKEAPKIDAPDDLQERLLPLFDQVHIHAVQYEVGVVQLVVTLASMSFRNFGILPVLVRAPLLEPTDICTEALLVDKEEDYGRCLLPLRQKGWYVDMAWSRRPTQDSRADNSRS